MLNKELLLMRRKVADLEDLIPKAHDKGALRKTIDEYRARVNELEQELQGQIAIDMSRRRDIIATIDTIQCGDDTALYKELLHYRYIHTNKGRIRTWESIAKDMNFSVSALKHMHKEALSYLDI